jgi:hypothetical protein
MTAFAQVDSTKTRKEKKIYLYGTVADGFTKAAIPDVKVILMRADSTVVDTTEVWESYGYSSGIGRTSGTSRYGFEVSRQPARYILKCEHPNYETAYADFEMKQVSRRRQDIEGPKFYLKKTARASHFEGGVIGEVVVKATKVKMVWRGDTLVFNADAFNMPEGSMLDALIKQLPGVELNDDGEIFVNGKKIDNLTLNGADFFKGKNNIMLQNLPYFTVKNIKVYKKQTEENKYLGIDDEDKKEYTMDVVLKREYSIGGSANVEAGGGPSEGGDWRYKLKGFGLRFSDRTRAVLFGGMNNINETMQYVGESSEYRDKADQSGDYHFRQLGGQFVYQAPEEKLTNSTEVNATWTDNYNESRTQSETFLNGASTFGLSESTSRSKPSGFSLKNTLRATGKIRFYSTTSIGYDRSRLESEGWNVSTADAVMHDSINSTWYRLRSKGDSFYGNGYGYLAYRLPSGDSFTFNVQGNFNRNSHPETTSLNHYTYHRLGTRDDRDRRTESPTHSYSYHSEISYNYYLTEHLRIAPEVGLGIDDNQGDRHEYLRDSIDYLFDTQNSYNQHTRNLHRRAILNIDFNKDFKNFYLGVYLGFSSNFERQRMDYESSPLTTSVTRNYTLINPNAYLYLFSKDQRHSLNMQYYIWPSTPSLTDLIDRPISTDPLNLYLGNPDLKKSEQHYWNTDYRLRNDSIDQTISLSLSANLTHNARTQGYTYDMTTGVRTYRPENISSGNWRLGSSVNWSRALDSLKYWHIGNELSIGYTKSTGLALVAPTASVPNTDLSAQSQLSRVGTLQLNYKPSLRFQKNSLSLTLKGDFTYRHYHRNIAFNGSPVDVWDIVYGFSGNYKLPWDFTIDTDLMMHSRRGYTDAEMNDNRLYWDASLTKSFNQGKWLLKLRGYDLLGQVSNLRYNINAQGRTETWTNSMRRYALVTVSYRFSQKPKNSNTP